MHNQSYVKSLHIILLTSWMSCFSLWGMSGEDIYWKTGIGGVVNEGGRAIRSFNWGMMRICEPSKYKKLIAAQKAREAEEKAAQEEKERVARNIQQKKGFAGIAGEIDPAIKDLIGILNGEYSCKRLDIPVDRGVLFSGPPGTGKTALARALAEELGYPIITRQGSEFIIKWQGSGPENVRNMFKEAREAAKKHPKGKALIFVDDCDALGSRSNGEHHEERNNTINQFLGEMDGFIRNDSCIIIGACNTPANLDEAFLRAGRFNRIIEIPLPDLKKRIALLAFINRSRPIDANVSYLNIAQAVEGCNIADLENLSNRAALLLAREQCNAREHGRPITQKHFNNALQEIRQEEQNRKKNYLKK